jgi:hypothetical protein
MDVIAADVSHEGYLFADELPLRLVNLIVSDRHQEADVLRNVENVLVDETVYEVDKRATSVVQPRNISKYVT